MQVLKSLQTLPDDGSRLFLGEARLLQQNGEQLAALAKLHDEVHILVVKEDFVEFNNVRMVHF